MAYEHIIIAGRSGVGKSSVAVNLSVALAEEGYRIAHVGYDPRRVATAPLRGDSPLSACGEECPKGRSASVVGFREILCVEAGNDEEGWDGAEFGSICRLEAMASHQPDFVVHDISGTPEAVFSFLAGGEEQWRLFVVTTADMHAIQGLNDFIACFATLDKRKGQFGGVIANNLTGPFYESIIADFIRESGALLLLNVPRSLLVHASEYMGRSVVEAAPLAHLTATFRRIAHIISRGTNPKPQRSLAAAELAAWAKKWSEIIIELETGVVRDGAAI